jgi:menaquinone-dependent protoporphyrinogen oxidase
MKVLVAVASKHGGTQEIAYGIGQVLSGHGLTTDVKNVETDGDIGKYQAVILGSAVYRGSWLKSAKHFVNKHRDELTARPVWLFSSGPVGDPLRPKPKDSVQVEEIMSKTKAREHHVFAGRLDRRSLNLSERAMIKTVGSSEGDFREWGDVIAWATEIAHALQRSKIKRP